MNVVTLDSAVRDFAKAPNFASLASFMPNGSLQSHVMWIDCDEEHIIFNTEVHRQKFRNIERDPRVTVLIWEKDNPYRFAEIRGRVVSTERGPSALAHIDSLAVKYMGGPFGRGSIQSERVIVRIHPDRQTVRG